MIKYVNALIICDISHHKMLNHMEEHYLKTMKQTIPDFIAIRFSSSYGMLLHRPALSARSVFYQLKAAMKARISGTGDEKSGKILFEMHLTNF